MDTNPSQSPSDSEALMEHIRKNPPAVKSINEVVGLLRAVSTCKNILIWPGFSVTQV